MSKPFTTIGAIVFLIVAAAHVYRIAAGFPVAVGVHDIPMALSGVAAIVSALLGIMLIVEARR